jgi:Na+-translocating ferredoxin:NAD+ oxidoreductase RnfC subunit
MLHLDNRRVPIARLIRKLGLHIFRNEGPLIGKTIEPRRVVLPLKQHAGAPAQALVRSGDSVRAGDVIARPADAALGAVIHASISGTVTDTNGSIVIES